VRAPTVSVVIATYNYGRFLKQAIDSVLAQTYTDYEIIVVDDGSTDNTRQVIQPYLALGNLSYFRMERNIGQPRVKNRGIRESRGKFIAFLDADDVWLPRKLEKQMLLFGPRQEVGVVYCDHVCFCDQKELPEIGHPPYARGWVTRELIFDNIVPFSSSVVRRQCFERDGMFDESIPLAIDYDLWLRFSLNWAFDYVPEKLLRARLGHLRLSSRGEERREIARAIAKRFLFAHKQMIDPSGKLQRQRMALSYFREGYANYRRGHRLHAFRCYKRSLSLRPFQPELWKAALALSLPYSLIRVIRDRKPEGQHFHEAAASCCQHE
jgi:glycosyltransferase involved in cell wall biosynthesis